MTADMCQACSLSIAVQGSTSESPGGILFSPLSKQSVESTPWHLEAK